MTKPKRHHWWPQLQSGRWSLDDGKIFCLKSNGEVFRTSPLNIGLEGHLYSKTLTSGSYDTGAEEYFANEIDGPFSEAFDRIFSFENNRRYDILDATPEKIALTRATGFRFDGYRDVTIIHKDDRIVLSNYLASLIVRSPAYLTKLQDFHRRENFAQDQESRNLAVDNMMWLLEIYAEKISNSDLMFILRDAENEFLYGDSPAFVREPWTSEALPFDCHIPMTPDISVNILPNPAPKALEGAMIGKTSNVGTNKLNRIVVGNSKNFIFSRNEPPRNFILKNLGVPAPAPYGKRFKGGKMEVIYDPSRDRI